MTVNSNLHAGIDLYRLAYDIADSLPVNKYVIDVRAPDLQPLLPAFL